MAAALLILLIGLALSAPAALAAVTSAVDKSNVLNVVSDAGDAIKVTCVSGLIKVNGGDPDSGLFACSKLAGIVVLGGPGDNAIDLSALAIGDLLPGTPISADGQSGNDTLTGGPYDQTLKGGAGDDVLRVKETGSATLLDGGEDGDSYEVDFGMLAAALNINDGGKVGFDTLTANGTPGDDSLQMDDTYLSRGTEVINFTLGSLEKATILAGNGKDLFLLLCDRFTTEFYGGPGSDTMTVKEIEGATLLDGGEDGDGYEVDFGMLAAALTIDDTGKSGFDALAANGTPGDDSLQMDDTYLSRGTEVINFTLGSLEKATILAGNGKDLFLLLCDRFTTEFYGGPSSDTMTVKEIEGATLLDGGEDGDSYEVDFGMLAAALTIDDTGKSGFDALAANGTPGDDSLQMDDTYLSRGTEVINFTLGSLEKATILAGNGKDLFLLLCDRFTTEFYGGPGSDTMTVKEIGGATLLDGGEDGDGYEVDFGMLAAALNINDGGKVGFDALTVKAPGAVRSGLLQAGVWLITSAQVTDSSESMSYSGSIEQLGFVGSAGDETIQVSPSPSTAIGIKGGGHVLGDGLVVDAGGKPVTTSPGQVKVAGLQPVSYQDIQGVQVINRGFVIYLPLVLRSS